MKHRTYGLAISVVTAAAMQRSICSARPAEDAPLAAATVPATAPSSPLPTATGDWPAFHGGGDLRGEAKAIGDRPLALRWTYKPADGPGQIEGAAAIVGPHAYVGDTKGRLVALTLTDGKPAWTYTVEAGFACTPLVAGGRVYVGDLEGVFHCVAADTGTKVWTFDTGAGQPIHASPNLAGDGRLVFGTDGADVFCLNLADGTKAWQVTTGERVNGAPAVAGGLAFVSGCDAKLRAIGVADGKERYAVDLGSLAPGSPAVLPDKVVIGTDGGRVQALAPADGRLLWAYDGVKDKAMVYASPAAAIGPAGGGTIVFGARDRQVHAIDATTGQKKWTFATRGDVDSSPAIAGNRVYVGSKDKKLYVLDLTTGKKLDEFQAGFAIEAAPAVGQGVVVVGDGRGTVYCLEPK